MDSGVVALGLFALRPLLRGEVLLYFGGKVRACAASVCDCVCVCLCVCAAWCDEMCGWPPSHARTHVA